MKKKKTTKIDKIVHHNLSEILASGHGRNFKRGFYLLKNSPNFIAKYETVNHLKPFYSKFVYGKPLPKTIEEIGVANRNFYCEKLETEMDWFIITARKHRNDLNLFLNYKKDFENYFLNGNYKSALDTVEKVENYLGYSIWSISGRLLVYEYTGMQETAKVFLSQILERNKRGLFTTSLVNYISQRSERRLSAYRYDDDVKNALGNIKAKLQKSNSDYYNFQLNYFEQPEFKNIKDVLCFDYSNSIIDRYLSFRKAVIYCIATDNKDDIKTDVLYSKITYLNSIIRDNIFDTITLILDPEFDDKSYFDSDYLKIIDLYYSGLYEECTESIRAYISTNEMDFNLINLYARSLVFDNKPCSPLSASPSIANEITELIYKICKRNSNPTESIYHLYQISKNIDFFDINFQLSPYIKIEQTKRINRSYYYLSSKKANPIIANFFSSNPESVEYVLTKISEKTYDSVAIKYKLNVLNNNYESIKGISNDKIEIDKAKYLYEKKDFEASLLLWNIIWAKNVNTPPILEIAIDYIFRIHFNRGEFDECIRTYVDSFLENPFLGYKIDTSKLRLSLRKARFKSVTIDIYLALFISLVSPDENEKAFVIELYCKSKGARLPSELFALSDFERTPLAELFFSFACSNETLNYYHHLNTTRKRLDERINICNSLTINFTENSPNYSQELTLLTNELIIHEGTQKLDQSKIYANDQAILNRELDEFEGLYNRYVTIAGLFLKNTRVLTINKNDLRYLDKKGEIEYSENEIEYSKNADIDTFYNLFSLIREKFLYSKFGIVTYLSTRIRHGVLLGEIRPELEKSNLIFFKNKSKDGYEPSGFWLNKSLTQDEKAKLTNLIANFSANIDALIDFIIKENIQIKLDGEHDEGWFDYEFSMDDLCDFSFTFFYEENYKAFCKKVLDVLWIRTDVNLEKIRTTLHDDIKIRFVSLINEFDGELNKLLGKDKIPEIFTALTACSTTLQNKIEKIASWFRRSGRTHVDFRLETLINIVCKNVQRAHPLKNVAIAIQNDFTGVIKGEFYEHFSDFIRIFVENVFKHISGNTANCLITIVVVSNDIIIDFENDNISDAIKLKADFEVDGVKKIDGIKLITEGKSGVMKARKIIKDDLKNDSNEVFVKIREDKFNAIATINYQQLLV